MAKDRTIEMRESAAFGKRLSQILSERHITQKELAKVLGETEVTVSRYLQGARTPKATVVLEIAKYLNVSMDSLYGYSVTYDDFTDLAYKAKYWEPPLKDFEKLHLIRILSE